MNKFSNVIIASNVTRNEHAQVTTVKTTSELFFFVFYPIFVKPCLFSKCILFSSFTSMKHFRIIHFDYHLAYMYLFTIFANSRNSYYYLFNLIHFVHLIVANKPSYVKVHNKYHIEHT